MKIISFSGIDGSGKSALAKRAGAYLNSKAISAVVIEPYKNSIYLTAGRILGSLSMRMKKNIENIHQEKNSFKNSIFNFIRKICLILDILIFYLRLGYFNIADKTIICDRYFFDILVHYIFIGVIKESSISFFLKIVPKPDISILLVTGERTAQKRESAHEDILYYERKNELYKRLSSDMGFIIIDSSAEEHSTWSVIEAVITEKLGLGKKNILMISRAIEPPWDEASKNLVRDIVSSIDKYVFHILSTECAHLWKNNVVREAIYNDKVLSAMQKFRLFFFLLRHRESFDLYHFCFTPEPFTSFLIKRIIKKNKSIQNIPYLTDNLDARHARRLIYSDAVVVNSNYTRQILKNGQIRNVSLIYPSVDTRRFSPQIEMSYSKNKLGILNEFNILWLGKFASDTEVKALDDIIYNTCTLDKRLNFIIGARLDGRINEARQGRLKGMLENRGLGKNVTFLNKVEDMAVLISACDIMIYPFFEGFKKKIDIPYVLVEAMSCGKPLVISDKKPINEIIRDGSGMAIPGDDSLGFARAIDTLYKDRELRTNLGSRNREAALRYFDLEKNVKDFERIYESLLTNECD